MQNWALVPKVGNERRLVRYESSIRIYFFCVSNCLSASGWLSSMRRLDLAGRVSEGAMGIEAQKDDVMYANCRVDGAGGKGIRGKKGGDATPGFWISCGMLCELPSRMFIRCKSLVYSLRVSYTQLSVFIYPCKMRIVRLWSPSLYQK